MVSIIVARLGGEAGLSGHLASLCMVCGRRRGKPVKARYRLADEPWDAWKKIRTLVICGFCKHKADATGYFGNSRIYVEEIIGGS